MTFQDHSYFAGLNIASVSSGASARGGPPVRDGLCLNAVVLHERIKGRKEGGGKEEGKKKKLGDYKRICNPLLILINIIP